MFRALREWWANRRAPARNVFTYRDGVRTRRADPLVLIRRIEADEPNWESLLGTVAHVVPANADHILRAAGEEKRKAATAKLVAVGRSAFGLPPLADDGSGTTEAEVIGVVVAFVAFLNRVAEDSRPFGRRPVEPASTPAAG